MRTRAVLVAVLLVLCCQSGLPQVEPRARLPERITQPPTAIIPASQLQSAVKDFPAVVEINWEALNRPDIVIENVTFTPSTYVPPQEMTARLYIRNVGVNPTGPFHCRWRPHPTEFSEGPGVLQYMSGLGHDQGGVVTFTYNYIAPSGEGIFEVDCYDEVEERNEYNNEMEAHPLISPSAWDFAVEDIWLIHEVWPIGDILVRQPVGGEGVTVKYRCRFANTINSSTLTTACNMYFDDALVRTDTLTIPANGTAEVSFSGSVANGPHTVRVEASPPEEAYTANNQMSKTWVWRARAHSPYRFEYFAICDYDAIGGGGNLSHSVNEGRKFYWKMVDRGHTCSYWAEDAGVNAYDWAYDQQARVNWADLAYYSGHGDQFGPWYSARAWDGGVLQMQPAYYRWGKDASNQPTLRWATWAACLTLYDGILDASGCNWYDPPWPLERWFQTFQGLHSIHGMRSLGWEGNWYEYDFPWWYEHDTRDRAAHYVNLLHDDYQFHNAWFIANRRTVYSHLDEGFESASLCAYTEGTDYGNETLTYPYPDYVGTPTGYNYIWYRIGSPHW